MRVKGSKFFDGRLIILRAKIDEFRFSFINVYAPNEKKNAVRIF